MITAWLGRAGDFVRGLGRWHARLFAFAMGAQSALAFAPIDFFPSLLLGVAALVLLIDGAKGRVRDAALLGWWCGFGQFLTGLYWIGYAFMVDPGAHAWQLPFAIVFLTGGLALFPAGAAALAARFWDDRPSRILLFSFAIGLSEWLRGHVFTGFPWNLAAYAWAGVPAILQGAAIVGAYGLTLLTVFLGASLAELFRASPRIGLPAAAALLFVLLGIGGAWRLAAVPTEPVADVNLRIVQPNVPQAEKYEAQYILRNWQRLLAPSVAPEKAPITVLIWPESAPPFLLDREPVALEVIRRLTDRGLTLITGAERVEFEAGGNYRFFNSLMIFGPQGRRIGTYDKVHLVPFGEYVPYAEVLNRIGITKLTRGEAGFTSGMRRLTFALPNAPAVGPLICYEIVFPGAVTGETRPQWIVNVTDDSWFGPWTGPNQHLVTARVRAIEEGLPIARAANTGISAVIDPLGRTIATLGLNKFGTLDAPLPAALAPTLYARFGDLGFWLLLIACGAAGWFWKGRTRSFTRAAT